MEIDHTGTVDGRDYYIVHFYEVIIDDQTTGAGHTATYGWYYVDKKYGDVYEMDTATGKLLKPSLKPNDSLEIEQISFKSYSNGRFQFSIDYPSTFVTKMLPDNGDGIKLESPDGSTELVVSGINNVLGESAIALFDNLVKEHNPAYKKQQDNWFVASWTEGDKIVYEKCVVGSGSENTFIIKYPSIQKENYDSIIEHLISTFKTPSINEPH